VTKRMNTRQATERGAVATGVQRPSGLSTTQTTTTVTWRRRRRWICMPRDVT